MCTTTGWIVGDDDERALFMDFFYANWSALLIMVYARGIYYLGRSVRVGGQARGSRTSWCVPGPVVNDKGVVHGATSFGLSTGSNKSFIVPSGMNSVRDGQYCSRYRRAVVRYPFPIVATYHGVCVVTCQKRGGRAMGSRNGG